MEQKYSEIILNRPDALHRAADDNDLLDELLEDLVGLMPQSFAAIRAAAAAADYNALERAAHAIKGAARNLSCEHFAWQAYRIECMGLSKNLDGFEAVFSEFENAAHTLAQHIQMTVHTS